MENKMAIGPHDISARAFGVLIAASDMQDGISNDKLSKCFKEIIGTIQKATSELRELGLLKTTTVNYGDSFVSTTDLTEDGRQFVQRVVAKLRFGNTLW